MDEFDFQESILARGWRDTKSAVHSFWFWAVEAGANAVIGLITQDPVVIAICIFGGFALIWIGATAGAPFKQLREVRFSLARLKESPDGPSSKIHEKKAEERRALWLRITAMRRWVDEIKTDYQTANDDEKEKLIRNWKGSRRDALACSDQFLGEPCHDLTRDVVNRADIVVNCILEGDDPREAAREMKEISLKLKTATGQ
ncbi:hypothetical protein [Roseovarius pacificus]|uniref:hypothetical protein n=1 Tax=Roseovarius pacificus TaxID=337701 RepID=UPI002A187EDC|nr:hypothetical protein [Roseovarius pacificus]